MTVRMTCLRLGLSVSCHEVLPLGIYRQLVVAGGGGEIFCRREATSEVPLLL